jgi:GMP synthase (glutamine-hydrolysing)
MTRLLIIEGNPRERRDATTANGLRTASGIYAEAISAEFPAIELDIFHAADPEARIPCSRGFEDYDGVVISGSALHAYDQDFAVTNQIAVLKAAGETGIPILGSCWGLQIAAMAAGGEVAYHPQGREVGIARKIVPTQPHRFVSGKGPVYDAPCIHYDEVVRLPERATLLASNAHSQVQAAIIPVGRSQVWAVQYHPEFDLRHLAQLFSLYAADMIGQGFFADAAALDHYTAQMMTLSDTPDDAATAWQLGIDADIIDDGRRRSEISTWIRHEVLSDRA